jgi:flagellar hook assembly protein FlgD
MKQGNQKTQLKIYDAAGRLMKSFDVGSSIEDRESSISWSGIDDANRKLGCGVYFVQLETQDNNITKKIVKLD